MRDNNLKNRMDDLHQDFDKEALWSRIESKKSKRKPIFWWVIGFGVFAVIVGITFYSIYDAKNTHITNKKYVTTLQKVQTSSKDSCTQIESSSLHPSNDIVHTSKLTLSQSTNINTENHPLTNAEPKSKFHSNFKTVAKNKKNDQKTLASKHYFNKNGSLIITNKNEHSQSIVNDTKAINDKGINLNVSNQQTQETDLNDFQKVTQNTLDEKINTHEKEENTEIANALSLLPNSRLNYLIISSRNFNLPSVLLISKPAPIQTKNNILSVAFGIGKDHHCFSNNTLGKYRQSLEKTLETKSLGIQYERRIHSFSLMANFTAAQSETELNHSTRSSNWRLVQDGSVINGWNGYQYKLYNQYQRLDADIQLLYHIDIYNKWQLSPSIGIGLNIQSAQQGHFFDVEGNLLDLSERLEYKSNTGIYLVYGLKIRRYIQKDFIIDLRLFAQSKRRLTDPNYTGYEQSIRPIGISFGFGRVF
ncbi:MAG TPA: hypothetical protein PKD51_00685 [Saprospiraceae bacterium]|nr:hypothetical protein [Saprospiraceae bacterium]